jgi:hypothetical protein
MRLNCAVGNGRWISNRNRWIIRRRSVPRASYARVFLQLTLLAMAIFRVTGGHAEEEISNLAEIRRVLVPSRRMREVLRNGIPVRREEVDRLWQERNSQIGGFANGHPVPSQLLLKAAWESPRTLRGTSTYVFPEGDRDRGPWVLGPWEMPIEYAVVENRNGKKTSVDLVFDRRGNFQISQSNVRAVHLDFVAIGREGSDGGVVFATEFPKALRSEVEIRHPASFSLALGGPLPPVSRESDGTTVVSRGLASGTIKELHFRPYDPKSTRELGWFHEQTTIDATLTKQTFTSHVVLESTQRLPEVLRFALETGLRVLEVSAGETPLEFKSMEEDGVSFLLVYLPDELQRHEIAVMIGGSVDIPLEKKGNLPRLDAPQYAWGSRRTTLQLSSRLTLNDLQLRNSELVRFDQTPMPAGGQRFQFVYENPDAIVRLKIVPQVFRGTFQVEEDITLSKGRSRFQANLFLQIREGDCFAFTFEVQKGWGIETVEALSETLVDDWFVSEHESHTSVLVRLKNPAQVPQTLPFRVRGEGPGYTEAKWIPSADFKLVQLPKKIVTDHLLRIRGDMGVSVTGSTAGSLVPSAHGPFHRAAEEVVVDATAILQESAIHVEPSVLVSDAQLQTSVSLIPGQIVQEFRVSFPKRSESNTVGLRIEPGHQNEIRWTVVGAVESRLPAIREESPPSAGRGPAETWTIAVPKDSESGFAIVGERVVPIATTLQDPIPIPLLTLSSAAAKKGYLHVEIAPELRDSWSVKSLLDRLPSRSPSQNDLTSTWEFTYDAENAPLPGASPRFVRATNQWHLAWVERALTTTYWAPGRPVFHETQYDVEHLGAQRIGITPSPGMRIVRIQRGQQQIPQTASGWYVDLPREESTTPLVISYETPPILCLMTAELRTELPKVNFPVLTHSWQVQTPVGFEISLDQTETKAVNPWIAPVQLVIDSYRSLHNRSAGVHLFHLHPSRSSGRLVSLNHSCLLGWCIFHFTLAFMLVAKPRGRYVLLIGLLAALCLASGQSPWQQMGSGMVLGLVLTGFFPWIRGIFAMRLTSGWPLWKARRLQETARMFWILAGWIAMIGPLCGESPKAVLSDETPESPAPLKINRYVPVDDSGNITGEYDYLEPDAYAELLSGHKTGTDSYIGLVSARYRLEFDRDAMPPRESLFEAEFVIANRSPSELIQLPWRLTSDRVAGMECWINDDSARVNYSVADGVVQVFASIPAGQHDLRLRLNKGERSLREAEHWGTNLPKCPVAEFEVRLPEMASQVQLHGSRGKVVYSNLEHVLRAQLGPAVQVELRFCIDQPPSMNQVASEGIEILQLEKGRLRVDAYWKIKDSQLPNRVSVAVPKSASIPRPSASDILALEDETPPMSESPLGSAFKRADIHLSTQELSTGVVHLTYYLPQNSLSEFVPGMWAANPANFEKKVWFAFEGALSEQFGFWADGQSVQQLGGGEASAIETRLNVHAGDSRRVFGVPLGNALAINPTAGGEGIVVTRTEEEFRFGQSADVACSWIAQIINCPANHPMFELELPADCDVASVSVEANGKPIDCRWIPAQDGQVTLFVAGTPPNEFRIKVDYHATIERGMEKELPACTIEGLAMMPSRRGRIRLPPNVNLTTNATIADLDVAANDPVGAALQDLWKWKQFEMEADRPLRLLLADDVTPAIVSEGTKSDDPHPPLRIVDIRPGPESLVVQTSWWLAPKGIREPVLCRHPEMTILAVTLGGQPVNILRLDRDEILLEPLITAGSLPLEMWVSIPTPIASSESIRPPYLKRMPASRTLWRYHRSDNSMDWHVASAERLSSREFEGECLQALLRIARGNATHWLAASATGGGSSLAIWQSHASQLLPRLVGTEEDVLSSARLYEEFASMDEISELRTLLHDSAAALAPVPRPIARASAENDAENRVRFASKNELGEIRRENPIPERKSPTSRAIRGTSTLLVTACAYLLVRLGRKFRFC